MTNQASHSFDTPEESSWSAKREAMVDQLRAYGVRAERVLAAMRKIPRHLFIPAAFRNPATAYADHPCPIGHDQTISQPYIVAYMTERLQLQAGEQVLEIGAGSGYQAAVLAECGGRVYSLEVIPALARHARAVLEALGYANVQILSGDGYRGWPAYAPFDAIIATCAPETPPPALLEQLQANGRMIAPIGRHEQRLVILRKKDGKVTATDDLPVRFVPMVPGAADPPPPAPDP
jgi:protein-L-isoaspartate(D-aspartate) O-methyltransferase